VLDGNVVFAVPYSRAQRSASHVLKNIIIGAGGFLLRLANLSLDTTDPNSTCLTA
jgi:hypothetical protein